MMPIRSLMLCLLLAIPFFSFSQDTLYLNNRSKPTKEKHATHYRITFPLSEGRYKIEDRLANGTIQMSGYYLSLDIENDGARDGHFVFYDYGGRVQSEGNFIAGKQSGIWKIYFADSDNLKEQVEYKSDSSVYRIVYDSVYHTIKYEGGMKSWKRIGLWKSYFANSTFIKEQTEHSPDFFTVTISYDSVSHSKLREMKKKGACPINAKLYYAGTDSIQGETIYTDCKRAMEKDFYKNGTLKRLELYSNDMVYLGHTYDSTGKEVPFFNEAFVYTYVEQMPVPRVNLGAYLSEHLTYPEFARKHNIEGRVITKFVVNEDGSISDIEVIQGIGAGCDEAAANVIAGMPPWRPGKQNGTPCKVFFTMPIVFKLTDK